MGRSKLFTFFLLGMFMLSFVSAWQSDNFIKDEDKINKLQTKTNYGKYIIEDTSWYDPLGIWTKKKTKEVTLKNNSDFCGEDCFAIKEIKKFEEGSLIDDIRFYRIYEDGSQQLSNIRSYQISYWGEDGWINYELGKIMPIGVYEIKLEGKKKPSWTYDWQILLGGTGVWSEEWAVWQGVNDLILSSNQEICGDYTGYNNIIINNSAIITICANQNLTFSAYGNFTMEDGTTINGFSSSTLTTGQGGGRTFGGVVSGCGGGGSSHNSSAGAGGSTSGTESNCGGGGAGARYGIYDSQFSATKGSITGGLYMIVSANNVLLDGEINLYGANGGAGSWDSTHCGSGGHRGGSGGQIIIRGTDVNITGADIDVHGGSGGAGFIYGGCSGAYAYAGGGGGGGAGGMISVFYEDSLINSSFVKNINGGSGGTGASFNGGVGANGGSGVIGTLYYSNEAVDISSYGLININSPTDSLISNTDKIKFKCSAEVTGGSTLTNMTLYTNETGSWGARNSTTGLSGTTSTQTWNRTFNDGDNILWSCQACDSDGDCGFAGENRTLSIDVGLPNITIETPTGILNYGVIGNSEILNVTFTDINLESCWYDYNGTNVTIEGCLTGVKNSTQFILEENNYNMTIYANDSVGNLNYFFTEWEYKLLETSQTYSNTTTSGSTEDFILNVTLGTGYDLTSASLIYGNETLSPSIVSSGQGRIISVSGYNIPLYQVDTNVSFYWEILLDDSTEINTTTNIQQVQAISLDNCSVYTFELFNLSLYTEREKTPLLGDIELNFQLLNYPDYEIINSLIINIENISTTKVCSDINLSLEDLYYSAEIRYSSEDYASELYHIQRATLLSTIQNIDLYDLNSNFSTEFKVIYQDSTFNFIEGAVIQLQRKYIAEGIYETVEAPLTSNDGIAIVHIDLDTVKYRATVVKDGVVLDEFDNLVLKCQSELTGECEQKLLGTIDPQNNIDLDTTRDFSYSIDRTDNVITTSFTIPSGTPSSVNFQLVQKDQFGSSEMCNKTITSSAGSLQCTFNDTIGDSYIDLRIYKNAEPMAIQTYIIPEASGVDFLGNNYIIIVVLLLSIVGMALTSPEWIIINGIIVMVISGALWLASGLDFVMGLGSLMWLIIAAGILIFKLAKQEDR